MNTGIKASAAIAALGLVPIAQAQVLDFEDLNAPDNFPQGTSFVTDGVTVNVEPFTFFNGGQSSGGAASVGNDLKAIAGNRMFPNNNNLDFEFSFPLTEICFDFDNGGGNVNVIVNGVLFNSNDMSDITSFNFGGPTAALDGDDFSGTIQITGVITEFQVGGQEFQLDNVKYVPTPGAAAMLGLAGLAGARRRRG